MTRKPSDQPTKSKTFRLRLEPDDVERLRAAALATGQTASEYVRALIQASLTV